MSRSYTPSVPGHAVSRCIAVGAFLSLLLFSGVPSAHAQEFEVEGVVLSAEDDTPLPGVNIVEVGTQTGTSSGPNGEFELTLSSEDAELRFSFVGFEDEVVSVQGRTELTVNLVPAQAELEEVVVTALGEETERRSLGYSVSSVESEDVVTAGESNITDLLKGEVAGVDISSAGGGVGSTNRVTIRGASGLGSNQPLYVIDGVPIDNSSFGSAGRFGGISGGSAINDINFDEVESVNVLKGGAAAALYGTRARDGVVEITTKSGEEGDLNVNFSSSTTLKQPINYFDDYQSEYGAGTQGRAPQTQDEATNSNLSSWGPRIADVDGSVIQPDGAERPYENRMDRIGFYDSATRTNNTLSVSGGTENITSYFSGTYVTDGNQLPKTDGLQKASLSLRSQLNLNRFSAEVRANYINKKVLDRRQIHDFPGNPNWATNFFPQTFDLDDMRPGFDEETLAESGEWLPNPFFTNPWFAINRFEANDTSNRLVGKVELGYDLLSWLTVNGRTGLDLGSRRAENVTPDGTGYSPEGGVSVTDRRTVESTTDLWLSATRSLPYDLSVDSRFGGTLRIRDVETTGGSGSGFIRPGDAVLPNMSNQSASFDVSEKEVRSFYGSVDLSFKNYLFFSVTGRNDWSSTLPEDNNSFFYPSASTGFVFSDAFSSAMPSWLDFGKVRVAWSEVGSDTDPYQLNLSYQFSSFSQRGRQLGSLAQGNIPFRNLSPTSTQEIELGTELRFLGERLTADFTWYDRNTTDQILSADVAPSTGFSSRTINAGELSNTGVEVLVTGVPVQTDNLRWSLRANFDRNINTVEAIRPGLNEIQLGQARVGRGRVVAQVGKPFSSIKGPAYVRDENGNIVHDEDGMPLATDEDQILGNGQPDWTGSLGTTFTYENLTVSAQVGARWGGQVFSATNAYATRFGLHEQTLEGRAACDEAGYPENGCWTPDGVLEDGTPLSEAGIEVLPENYWATVYSTIGEEFVYDRNAVRLRSLRMTYQIPSDWLGNLAQSARISLVGRDLFYLYDNVPNVDPFIERDATNSQGIEGALVPTTRSYGVNIDLSF
jgi:TonB-linked SusC/RagA family outer membrane protein